ncbi:metallophosphatase family protein [bacterium]|nr:metallophosphatase family protein [bacterium]
MTTRVGVISDTHIERADDARAVERIARELFADVDLVIHAGDHTNFDLVETIFLEKPFHAVCGNMDAVATRSRLPLAKTIRVEDVTIAIAHGHTVDGHLPDALIAQFPEADVIVFGHTHRALCERRGNVLLLNPGAISGPRGGGGPTVAILAIDGGSADARLFPVRREAS